MRIWPQLALFLVILALTVLGWLRPWQSWLPIRHVRVQGVFAHIDQAQVEQSLLPVVNTGFLAVDLRQIEQQALSLPWVRAAKIRRVWPDTLDIRLYEQVPVARWRGKALVNDQGQLFIPEHLENFRHLPLLIGPEAQPQRSVATLLNVQEHLADHNLLLTELQISASRAWRLKLAPELEIMLGTRQQATRLDQLLNALALFEPDQRTAMARIDMRYPNGFSVAWQADSPAFNWRKIAQRH
ncbi:MAG: FtsQ-type POTRA domain-containing protein [Methylococcales bacterium]|nr:FtsQ-type POTRA domain-containing protein [Methylococcales bacterium]